MIENIVHNNQLLSIIIRSSYVGEGISFLTPDDYPQQLGYMNRQKGYEIPPHVHNMVERKITMTQEVLFIKSGKVRLDYFDDDKKYLESRIVETGDVILLAAGGHGFKMLENSEIIEVKQGPYCGDTDKTRFNSIDEKAVDINLKF
jgi:hypothetical protein